MDKTLQINFEKIFNFFPYAIILILLILGVYSSYNMPIGNDAGKYFTVIKEIVNGSDINSDISGGTVKSWFYIITKSFFIFKDLSYEEFRVVLVLLNFISLFIFIKSAKDYYSQFVINISMISYALTPFILQNIIEINHYSITNIFMILGFSLLINHIKSKKVVYYLISITCFIIISLIRPHLIILVLVCFGVGIYQLNYRKIQVIISTFVIILFVLMMEGYYFNGQSTNTERLDKRDKLTHFIQNVSKEEQFEVALKVIEDSKNDLLNINNISLVGNDPSYYGEIYDYQICDSKRQSQYRHLKEDTCYYKPLKAKTLQWFVKQIDPNWEWIVSKTKDKKTEMKYKWNFKENNKDNNDNKDNKDNKDNFTIVKKEVDNQSLIEKYRLIIILDHIKIFLESDNFQALKSLIKVFIGFTLSPIMGFLTIFTLYYILSIKNISTILNQKFIILILPLGFLSMAAFVRYMTNQEFSYFLHPFFFMTIIASMGLEKLVAGNNLLSLRQSRIITFIMVFYGLTIVFFHIPKVKVFNPIALSMTTSKDKELKFRETITTPKNLRIIGEYLDNIAEKRDVYISDFSGFSSFTNTKLLYGIEMNQHRFFYSSTSVYDCLECNVDLINNTSISLLGIEHLINHNKISAVVNFGEIDKSFFRRNIKKLCLRKNIGGIEIWIPRIKYSTISNQNLYRKSC